MQFGTGVETAERLVYEKSTPVGKASSFIIGKDTCFDSIYDV